jgi:hypothetical protein
MPEARVYTSVQFNVSGAAASRNAWSMLKIYLMEIIRAIKAYGVGVFQAMLERGNHSPVARNFDRGSKW